MNESDESPRLVGWIKAGCIPGEIKREIQNAELNANLQAKPPTTEATIHLVPGMPLPPELEAFVIPRDGSIRGVEFLCREILRELRSTKEQTAKLAALRWRAYALLMWCYQEQKAPPAPLMRLLFECLDLHDGQPPPPVCKRYRWPNPNVGFEKYQEVVDLDAQSIVRTGRQRTTTSLSKLTSIDRKTIDAWRQSGSYRMRRDREILRLIRSRRGVQRAR